MHPLLIKIGTIEVYSYGILIAIGFLVSLHFLKQKARKAGYSVQKISDLAFYGLGIGMLGGRVLYVLTTWETYKDRPLDIFKIWEGGFVFYGGLITGVGSLYFLSRRYKFSFLKILDMSAPTMAIGHAFGRIGCFLAGCCYGRACDLGFPLAVQFNDPMSLAPKHVWLHPAQLYDSLNAFIIFGLTEFLYKKKTWDGQIAIIYCFLYAVGRLIVESFRGDADRGFLFNGQVSTSQFIAYVMIGASLVLYIFLRPRRRGSV